MIKPQSDDPDVAAAAGEAAHIIEDVLHGLPPADEFDYGGHELHIGEYSVCERCTRPIAEAQAAEHALRERAEKMEDSEVKEHVELAAELLRLEAEAAQVRAELHNGQNSEHIVNMLLGFIHDRQIGDRYDHSHHGNGGAQ